MDITRTNENGMETYSKYHDAPPELFSHLQPVHITQEQFVAEFIRKEADTPVIVRLPEFDSSATYLLTSSSISDKITELSCTVIRERPYFEKRGRSYSNFEGIIKSISNRLLNATSTDIDQHIEEALGLVGEYLQTDRSYLFLIDDHNQTISNTHEWVNHGIVSFKDELQNIPYDELPWLMEQILEYKTVSFDETSTIPDVALNFREEMEKEGIKSIVVVPIKYENRVVGFTGFDSVRSFKSWDESSISFLRIIGEIFLNALKRLEFNESVKRSRQLYRAMFEHTKQGVFISNYRGKIMEWNQSFLDIFGYSDEEMEDITMKDLYWDPAKREETLNRLMKQKFSKDMQIEMKNAMGEKIRVKTTVTLQQTKDKEGPLFFSIIRDVTEEMKQQERLLQNQKLESLGILAGGIAHDFNNILMSVTGFARIGEDISNDHEITELFRKINATGTKASALIQQLLTFAGSNTVKNELKNINKLIIEMREILLMAIKHNSLLDFDLANNLPQTMVDTSQFSRLILNLVLNADEAHSNMDTAGMISIKTQLLELTPTSLDALISDFYLTADGFQPGMFIEISVKDIGEGIAKERLTSIFDPFFTTKFTGRGLGLASVLGVVNQHRGAIRVITELGQGTTFFVYIPVITDGDTT